MGRHKTAPSASGGQGDLPFRPPPFAKGSNNNKKKQGKKRAASRPAKMRPTLVSVERGDEGSTIVPGGEDEFDHRVGYSAFGDYMCDSCPTCGSSMDYACDDIYLCMTCIR